MAATGAAGGLQYPVLVRPVGSHGGLGLALAADGAELENTSVEKDLDVYLTVFHDFQSADGFYRKYRVIFVDRRPFPLSSGDQPSIGWCTIKAPTWPTTPNRIAEELRFLIDPARRHRGARAMAAIEAIGQRLDSSTMAGWTLR